MPFTRDEPLAVFLRLNEALWPAQAAAHLAALVVVAAIAWPQGRTAA